MHIYEYYLLAEFNCDVTEILMFNKLILKALESGLTSDTDSSLP